MENRSVIVYGGELYHHGIKGQKWGVRNGPPYPIEKKYARENHRYNERKAREKYRANRSSLYEEQARKEEAIERPYKKGETLSDKDYKKQEQLWNEYSKKRADNKEQYKKSLSEARQQYLKETNQKSAHREGMSAEENWRRERKDFIKTRSTGSRVATFLLNGAFGEYQYNSMRTAGYSAAVSLGATAITSTVLPVFGPLLVSTMIGNKEVDRYREQKSSK